MFARFFCAFAHLGEGGPDEPGAEDVENPGEVFDEGGAEENEDEAQDEGDDDAEEEDFLLEDPGHREGGDHHDEDEEVVDGQGLFGDVSGEVFLAVFSAPHCPDDSAEEDRHRDVGD